MKRARKRAAKPGLQRAGAATLNRALRERPGGAHGKSRKAERRAQRVATRRLTGDVSDD